VKLLRAGRQSAQQQRRFEYESQLLARVPHRAIAQVFEAGTHESGDTVTPYFAMEFIPGARSITRYAQEHKLSLAARLKLMAEVCDAVHHAHTKGIIHRDQARNISLTRLASRKSSISGRAGGLDQFAHASN
jgi:serine/threonine protein kinase